MAGIYNGIILHEAPRIPLGVHPGSGVPDTSIANTARNVFCGAQAAAIAFGQNNEEDSFTWVEELFDYGNNLGVAAGTIYGLKKTRFNNADFGSIVMSTYAARHS